MSAAMDHQPLIEELRTTSDVRARYRLAGPHLTAAMRRPAPGSGSDATMSRWHSHEQELIRSRASQPAIDQLRAAYDQLPANGECFLLTATAQSAAWCELPNDPDLDFAVTARAPRLLPALAEVERHDPIVAVLVDKTGADVFTIMGGEIQPVLTIEGETEVVHRGPANPASRGNHHREDEQLTFNARLIAKRLAAEVDDLGAELLVLSGDDRSVDRVCDQLPNDAADRCHKVQAGTRHEPNGVERLADETNTVVSNVLSARRSKWLARLAEEVGQGDRGCLGLGPSTEQIMAGLVDVLYVSNGVPAHDYFDLAVARAFETGAEVIVVPSDDAVLRGKEIGALLRRSRYDLPKADNNQAVPL